MPTAEKSKAKLASASLFILTRLITLVVVLNRKLAVLFLNYQSVVLANHLLKGI